MKIFLIVSSLVLSSCAISVPDATMHDTMNTIKYTRDSRTGECFGEFLYDRGLSVTWVPCTERVLTQIR